MTALAPTEARRRLLVALVMAALPWGLASCGGEDVTVHADVEYSPGLVLDIYEPVDDKTSRPAVVMVHGGGWGQGNKADLEDEGRKFAAMGWVAFAPNYVFDTEDEAAWPDELLDIQTAVRWVAQNAETYGVDADRIGMLGSSAGAHLSALVSSLGTENYDAGGRNDPADDPVKVQAVVLWSPPVDLATLVPENREPPPGCGDDEYCIAYFDFPVVELFLKCKPAECPDRYEEASPITHVGAQTTPTMTFNSEDELVPLAQVQDYHDTLDEAGIENELKVFSGHRHDGQFADDAWGQTVAFLSDYLAD